MKIQQAKLCLDCDELYTGEGCPVCASRVYVYINKWITNRINRYEDRTKAL